MAEAAKPEWRMTDAEAVTSAISRNSGVPAPEIRRIHQQWATLRKKALNPATLVGLKY